MTDKYLFDLAIAYHRYLQSCNFGNSTHKAYAWMVTRHAWFDDHDTLNYTHYPQLWRVTRLVRRYLKNT